VIVFEWDEEKEWSNFLKHKIRFHEAEMVWKDEHSLELIDEFHSDIEQRLLRIGFHPYKGILMVVFCERGTSIRIISARKADKTEKEYYERSLRLR